MSVDPIHLASPGRLALEAELDARVAAAPSLRWRLLSEPHAAIEEAIGLRPPDELPIAVHEENEYRLVLVLRSVPPGDPGPTPESPRIAFERVFHEVVSQEPYLLGWLRREPREVLRERFGAEVPSNIEVVLVEDDPVANVVIRHATHLQSSS